MKQYEVQERSPQLLEALLGVWEDAVRATHLFLSEAEICQIKDVHISGLLADLMHQTPVTAENFRLLKGKILLILPDQDFFSGKMQADLVRLMQEPKIAYVSGGHLSTALKAEDYIRTIRDFLSQCEANAI